MRHSPLRHLITAAMALAFMATVAACSSASPRALPVPETTATPAAPVPSTAAPSTPAPTTTTRRATHSATSPPTVEKNPCVPFRSEDGGFYEAATIGTEQLTTPRSRCTTISVSDVRDPDSRPPTDTCGHFYIGFWPITDNGSLTYTEPVIACSSHRTVLARNVPNDARYLVIYEVEHFDPAAETMTHLTFRIWH
jgi:hypothetical protein